MKINLNVNKNYDLTEYKGLYIENQTVKKTRYIGFITSYGRR